MWGDHGCNNSFLLLTLLAFALLGIATIGLGSLLSSLFSQKGGAIAIKKRRGGEGGGVSETLL